MQKLSALVSVLVISALISCSRVEVVKVEKCAKVVGIKNYVESFLGVDDVQPTLYYVLDDGREIKRRYNHYEIGDSYCISEYVPIDKDKDLQLDKRPPG